MKIIKSPSIYLISSSSIKDDSLFDFFLDIDEKQINEPNTPMDRLKNVDIRENEGQDLIEIAGRMCYQSWEKGRNQPEFIKHILEVGHGNLLAHVNVTLLITGVSRSLTHELIRHHVGTNPSQESQRYVNQDTANLVIPPLAIGNAIAEKKLEDHFQRCLDLYREIKNAIEVSPTLSKTEKRKRVNEFARSILPACTETRLCWTMNLRAARNILEQRGDQGADLEIRRFAVAVLRLLQPKYPEVFEDFTIEKCPLGFEFLKFKWRKV